MAISHSRPRGNPQIPVEVRTGLVKRFKDGESKKNLAAEFGVSRQYIDILLKKHEIGGDEALIPKPPGRPRLPEGSLSPEQFQALVTLVESSSTPGEAGLNLKKQPERWTPVNLRALIAREYRIRLNPGEFALLQDRLGIQRPLPLPGELDEDFDADFYAYMNSPIGQEMIRRERELLERDREAIRGTPTPRPKAKAEPETETKQKPQPEVASRSPKKGPNFQKPKRRKTKKRR
jgi:transposase